MSGQYGSQGWSQVLVMDGVLINFDQTREPY
jgi:hypothetical protein